MRYILVVEENVDTRWLLREVLEDAGYDVVSASTIGDADFLMRQIPDLNAILLNWSETPAKTRFLKSVRGTLGDIPVVAISSESVQKPDTVNNVIHRPIQVLPLLEILACYGVSVSQLGPPTLSVSA